jgi:hypothetical protein
MIVKIAICRNLPSFFCYLSIAGDEKISRMIILFDMILFLILASGHGIIPHRYGRKG